MNRRNQDRMTDADVLVYLKRNYIYDAERGKLVRRETGRVVKGTNRGHYMSCDIKKRSKVMHFSYHHAVWAVVNGRLPTQIDHINGDKTDNRIENLREVDYSGNDANRLLSWKPNAQTGLPGVTNDKGNFVIRSSGKRFYFPDKYQAFHALVLLGRMFRPN